MSYKKYEIKHFEKMIHQGNKVRKIQFNMIKEVDGENFLIPCKMFINEKYFKKKKQPKYVLIDEKSNVPIAVDNKLILTDQYKKLSFWKRLKIYLKALLYILYSSSEDSL